MAMNVLEAHAWECWGPLPTAPQCKEIGYPGLIYICRWCHKVLDC